MVFESVLASILNKVLGDYVENLDSNQLSVGIWGGDVELKDLVLKQTALDALDLPVQCHYGKIGKLVLKIPWKNLYNNYIVVNVEEVYLLSAPISQIKYDPDKEKARENEVKQKELQKVEDAKKFEKEKDKPKANTFTEKLITQIIKNIQMNIRNIHFRYEDKISNPSHPFALGVTLSNLEVVSTDSNWKNAITYEDVQKIHKVVNLEGFAVYWNSNTKDYLFNMDTNEMLTKMKNEITSKDFKPQFYTYILGPISASARVVLNQKPELDNPPYTIPKVHLNVDMGTLFIGVNKYQYQDIIKLVDSMSLMSKGIPFRKFRPNVPYKEHYKEWWLFAYECIMESEVRRRHRNWDWNHIAKHRFKCKEYRELYQKKLTNTAKGEDLKKLEECEESLDLLNLLLIRQRIEVETERQKVEPQATKSSWFGYIWGSSPSKEVKGNKSTNIIQQFEDAMTPEEKSRLYKALDYRENAAPAQYPITYIDNSCVFLLRNLNIELSNETERVIFTELKGVRCRLDTRVAASGLDIHVKIDEFVMYGLKQNELLPKIISSELEAGENALLEAVFQVKPTDKLCDQRLHVNAQPLKITYDGQTILKALDIFKMPHSTALNELQAMAESKLMNLKEMSATGLQHVIETHAFIDLKIDLHSSYIIIPHGGIYTENENVLIINLGYVKMFSIPRSKDKKNVRKLHAEGADEKKILSSIFEQSYDKFKIELTDMQVIFAQSNENWKHFIKDSTNSDMHILFPVNVHFDVLQCLVNDDPRLPFMKVMGRLPSVHIDISDARLLLLIALGLSIPKPAEDLPESRPLAVIGKKSSSMLVKYKELQETASRTKSKLMLTTSKKTEPFVQFTTLDVKFVMSEFSLNFQHQTTIESRLSKVASFKMKMLESTFVQQTYNTVISIQLNSIDLEHYRKTNTINIITTPISSDLNNKNDYFIEMKFIQVDKNSPEFHHIYKSCETALIVNFARLHLILHQESLVDLINLLSNIQTKLDILMSSEKEIGQDHMASIYDDKLSRKLSTIEESSDLNKQVENKTVKRTRSINAVIETIKFKLSTKVQEVCVDFQTEAFKIAHCAITGIKSDIIAKDPYTEIVAHLKQITITDLNPNTIHKQILTVVGDEALSARIVMYNEEYIEFDTDNIKVYCTMGGLRIIFLNWFVTRLLNFLNKFQAAQEKLKEAAENAAETAKLNMKNIYAKATKISLNINLKAPDIIVPANSTSYDAIVLDLGYIKIFNTFLTLDIQNQEGNPAVIDELKMNLTDFKLSKINLDKRTTYKEIKILEPINVTFSINRNLSSSWYKAVPDIDIQGNINNIVLELCHNDYQVIMSILNGNLAEGESSPQPVAKKVEKKAEFGTRTYDTTTLFTQNLSVWRGAPVLAAADIDPKVHIFLRFSFTMDKLIISLFKGDATNLTGTDVEKDGLAKFSLECLSLKGRILTDDSMLISILLVNCLLEDMRSGREGKLKRLIERTIETNDVPQPNEISTRSMLDITFHKNEQDIFADVRIYSFTIILSVDYLLQLANFFKQDDEADVTLVATNKHVPVQPIVSTKTVSNKVSNAPQPTQNNKQTMTINLKIEKPDIILVEHMDNIDTNALILNSEVVLKLRLSGLHQVINGSIKDFQLFTCNYNPLKRAETKSHVLHPVTFSLAGSTPDNKGLHIDLMSSDIHISVSPPVIELLHRISVTVTSGDDKEKSNAIELPDHSAMWEPKTYEDQDYWFLKPEFAMEATEDDIQGLYSREKSSTLTVIEAKAINRTLEELCMVSIPLIMITLEAGVGNKTFPMLLFESKFQGCVRNWSTNLSIESSLTLEMGYYNSRLALWEPLIEPVEVIKDKQQTYVPWELKLEVTKNDNEEQDIQSPTENDVNVIQIRQPMMSVDIISENNLELTVTKTCLDVLNNLGKAFSEAMSSVIKTTRTTTCPYKIINETGEQITILLDRGSFQVFGDVGTTDVVMDSGTEVLMELRVQKDNILSLEKELSVDQSTIHNYSLSVKIISKNVTLDLPVVRADKRFFPLNYTDNDDTWGIISDIKVDEGSTIITLRSILQVCNHFTVPIEVYYMTAKGNELASLAIIQPDSYYNVPLYAVYTPTNELFFSLKNYSVTTSPYIWKDLRTNLTMTKILQCRLKKINFEDKRNLPFNIKAIGEMEQVYYENSSKHTMSSTCYIIHLRPAITFKNCLPIEVVCCVEGLIEESNVSPGDSLMLPNVECGKSAVIIRLPNYLEKEWSCRYEIPVEPAEFSVLSFNNYVGESKMILDLGIHSVTENGSTISTLYCPFWMLNKTGLLIGYRKSKKTEKLENSSPAKHGEDSVNVLYHPADFKGPILFSFSAKHFFGKKKASIKVEQGEWSDKFSLDTAGSSGFVACKYNNAIFQIGVHNQLTYNGLTKQVTFTPYYVLINNAPFAIECQESDRPADSWIKVESNSCTALWPKGDLDDKLLKAKVSNTNEVSMPFLFTESHTTLLKLNNKYGGINVDIQITEGGIYINFTSYEIGMAPALIINHTKNTMHFWEKESIQMRNLAAKTCVLYTWENPSGPRVLAWEIYNKKEWYDDLRKDGLGEYEVGDYIIYWISFLDGMQRVLLFTDNKSVAEDVQSAKMFEVSDMEITVSICGVGFSLVNNLTSQEVMYLGIASTGIIWEYSKMNGKRYKQFNSKDSFNLENAYQRYLREESFDLDYRRTLVDTKTEADFKNNLLLKPNKRRIRRTFETGLWLQMKMNPTQSQLHAKINRLQIDNQMYSCIFPVVLAPVPPPKSVYANSGVKPFVELSIVQLLLKNSQIKQYKYFKVLVQEFHIKIDLGFINALLDILQSEKASALEIKQQFLNDLKLTDEELYSHVSSQSLQEQKSFYDLLHFSPLKIHFSFSLASGSSGGANMATPNFMKVLLQGVGVTLTDLQDVVFKLAFFERQYTFLTQKQLLSEVTKHYIGQSIKQLYVLVLGLDLLGNPYGLVVGITKGVEDLFYEPFHGAIQGPDEFAEGLVLGVRSLFGHTVGGAAGAVSRITGAFGKGISALTFDEDFQRKRRDQINKKPASAQEGIARSGKSLIMGVVGGVTGVFTKPISGAREEGVGGFFKGLGKGAVGLVARPTAGVVDFASGSLEVVKRATEVGEETNRLRIPRFIASDGLVRPYNRLDSEGHKLLVEMEKGKYAITDAYVQHYVIIEKRDILLLTDKRIAYATHNDLFGGWQVDWSYTWSELKQPAVIVHKGVHITTSDKKKKLFSSDGSGKVILISDPKLKFAVCKKIEKLRSTV